MRALFAGTSEQAFNSAVKDWGWVCIKRDAYQDDQGELVRYYPPSSHLPAIQTGTVAYFGYGWQTREDADELRYAVANGRFAIRLPI